MRAKGSPRTLGTQWLRIRLSDFRKQVEVATPQLSSLEGSSAGTALSPISFVTESLEHFSTRALSEQIIHFLQTQELNRG